MEDSIWLSVDSPYRGASGVLSGADNQTTLVSWGRIESVISDHCSVDLGIHILCQTFDIGDASMILALPVMVYECSPANFEPSPTTIKY